MISVSILFTADTFSIALDKYIIGAKYNYTVLQKKYTTQPQTITLSDYNRHLLAVPRFRFNTYGRRAFSVAGPMAWNSLLDFIRDPSSSTDLGVYLKRTCSRITSASSTH